MEMMNFLTGAVVFLVVALWVRVFWAVTMDS